MVLNSLSAKKEEVTNHNYHHKNVQREAV